MLPNRLLSTLLLRRGAVTRECGPWHPASTAVRGSGVSTTDSPRLESSSRGELVHDHQDRRAGFRLGDAPVSAAGLLDLSRVRRVAWTAPVRLEVALAFAAVHLRRVHREVERREGHCVGVHVERERVHVGMAIAGPTVARI